MSWIVRSLCSVILGVLKMAFTTLSGNFIALFGINVGAKFPTMASPNSPSLAGTLSSYAGDTSTTAGSNVTDLFDQIFPVAAFKTVMIVTAIALIVMLTVFSLVRAGAGAESVGHPLNIIGRFVLGLIGIIFSYRLFIIAEWFFNRVYIAFQSVAMSKAVLDPNGIFGKESKGKFLENTQAINNALDGTMTKFFDPSNVSAYFGAKPSTGVGTSAAVGAKQLAEDGMGESVGVIFFTLVCLVALGAILINFFKLLLEMVERYVLLGVMFYTAPLPFVAIGNKETMPVFSSWVRMVFSQFLLIILNAFFLNSFLGAMFAFGLDGVSKNSMNMTTYMVYLFCLIAWLLIGQKVDQHLRALGLSTAQAGGSMAGAVMAAASGVTGMGIKSLAKTALGRSPGARMKSQQREGIAKTAFGNGAGAKQFANNKKVERGEGAHKKIMDNLNKQNPAMKDALAKNEGAINKKASRIGNGEQSLKFNNGGGIKTVDQGRFDKLSSKEKSAFTSNGDGTYTAYYGGSGSNAAITTARAAAASSSLNKQMSALADKQPKTGNVQSVISDSVGIMGNAGDGGTRIHMMSSNSAIDPINKCFRGSYVGDGNSMLSGFDVRKGDTSEDLFRISDLGDNLIDSNGFADLTEGFGGHNSVIYNREKNLSNLSDFGALGLTVDGRDMLGVQTMSLDPSVVRAHPELLEGVETGKINGIDTLLMSEDQFASLKEYGGFDESIANGKIKIEKAEDIYFKEKPLTNPADIGADKDAFEEFMSQ